MRLQRESNLRRLHNDTTQLSRPDNMSFLHSAAGSSGSRLESTARRSSQSRSATKLYGDALSLSAKRESRNQQQQAAADHWQRLARVCRGEQQAIELQSSAREFLQKLDELKQNWRRLNASLLSHVQQFAHHYNQLQTQHHAAHTNAHKLATANPINTRGTKRSNASQFNLKHWHQLCDCTVQLFTHASKCKNIHQHLDRAMQTFNSQFSQLITPIAESQSDDCDDTRVPLFFGRTVSVQRFRQHCNTLVKQLDKESHMKLNIISLMIEQTAIAQRTVETMRRRENFDDSSLHFEKSRQWINEVILVIQLEPHCDETISSRIRKILAFETESDRQRSII